MDIVILSFGTLLLVLETNYYLQNDGVLITDLKLLGWVDLGVVGSVKWQLETS